MAEEKVARGVGYQIRCDIKSPWTLHNSLLRTVAVRKISPDDVYFRQCQDCRRDSEFLCVELTRFTPQGRKKREYPLAWGWCGTCDIGLG